MSFVCHSTPAQEDTGQVISGDSILSLLPLSAKDMADICLSDRPLYDLG